MLTLLSFPKVVSAQKKDSLVTKNGNVIVGELKLLDKGVVTIETDYSKNDFTIEWNEITAIYSGSHFLITLKDGLRVNGSVKTDTANHTVIITKLDSQVVVTKVSDIVYLKGLKSDFWSRANASIDMGISVTKANNLRQFTVRSNLGYMADKWEAALFYNDLRSKQDSVNETRRTEWGPSFKYFMQNDWFGAASLNFLSNTEQALDLRTTGKLGVGKYFIHTNKTYIGAAAGIAYNREVFTNETASRSSVEAYFGYEVNLFDVKDFSLLTNGYAYPSLTESGRWRADFSLDAKYDLPLNFYLKFGGTLNYDNQPAVAGKDTDYVLAFTFGWEL
ncbi:DUF481 domain-containing protein [Chitinophaga barathri]|uniref:DUF481 domain-containing protein n=1 Tax=Chitinophaga barathri TaxID=1647451 RepID=UPI0019D4D944|nr:DUF481 domain-containing protein [Chitinophaga barathri]